MEQPSLVYEIELKALLSEEKYKQLCSELPSKMRLFNEETIYTTRYRPGDLRLRHSDKRLEIICKDGDPTKISRKEVKIPLYSQEQLDYLAPMFRLLGFNPDPSWTKHKREFEYDFKGFTYVVCLQNIEKFAYIMEVEFLSEKDDSAIHEPNLRAIIQELGCEPIEPADFSRRIKEYIDANRHS
jgi:hypothetical protein